MRIPLFPFIVMAALFVAIDIYLYFVARRRCRSHIPSQLQLWSAIALYVAMVIAVILPRRSVTDGTLTDIMWMLFSVISIYTAKITFVLFDLIAVLPRLWHGGRWRWVSLAGGIAAIAVFLSLWWGALVNRFRVQVREVEVMVENLPPSFDGFTIAQFSDLHTGTFGSDTSFVSHLVSKINSLNPDVIVFTGDIVNRHSEELRPFIGVLSNLDAPYGVYSILGNHDYGDYALWASDSARIEDVKHLCDMQKSMGWQMLNNSADYIRHDNDSIVVIGVENVGDPPFKIYGSLADSYPSLSDSLVKILLTHNPAHWIGEVADRDSANIALTLSGHTHAMQMELGGVSPAALRYRTWGGEYEDKSSRHKLYVNIGSGTVGMPVRLGATPEVTLITLRPVINHTGKK